MDCQLDHISPIVESQSYDPWLHSTCLWHSGYFYFWGKSPVGITLPQDDLRAASPPRGTLGSASDLLSLDHQFLWLDPAIKMVALCWQLGTTVHLQGYVWVYKYCPIRVLFFNRQLRIADHCFKTPIWIIYQYSTAMASRRSFFNGNRLVYHSFIGGLAHELAVNRGTKSLIVL